MTGSLRFLGTGASGGTPGAGRAGRTESSALLRDGDMSVLLDVTRHVDRQLREVERVDVAVLTHAHVDASGGMAKLRSWWSDRGSGEPIPVVAHPGAAAVVRERHRRLDHVRFVEQRPGREVEHGDWLVSAVEVPHARGDRYPTCAWRLRRGRTAVVYASDVGSLTADLAGLADGATLLVLDGAMWGRRLFAHLTVDRDLPEACGWDVERILLTQIGKTAPPHQDLAREVGRLCSRAAPAYDGLVVDLGELE